MCGGEVTPSSGLPTTRPIWPGCPELIYQRYLAEKEAWLTEHHSVRPSSYRKARGFKSYSARTCTEHTRFLPSQRLDLETETFLEGRPHWSTEEVQAWLYWDERQQEEVNKQVEAELIAAGGFGKSKERGIKELWNRVDADIEARKAKYRFV